MYEIFLTPTNTNFKPHVWKEGGEFTTAQSAEFQAKQLRKMPSIHGDKRTKQYSSVEVVPIPKILDTIEAKDLDGKVIETYEVIERTFFAKTLRVDSAIRKRMNKIFLHSNTLEEYKIALRVKSTGGTLGYRTRQEAVNAANNLAK